MTKTERDEILCYIAQDFVAPIARTDSKVFDELAGYRFNQLVSYLNTMVDAKKPRLRCPNCGSTSQLRITEIMSCDNYVEVSYTCGCTYDTKVTTRMTHEQWNEIF